MSRRHVFALTSMTVAFGRWGKPDEAERLLREMAERAERSYVPATNFISPPEALGRRDRAIQYAERAWAEREPGFILFARHFPEWRSIRSDPRFQAILREMDAPVEERR
jgi:pentatricopeptide repeat protein